MSLKIPNRTMSQCRVTSRTVLSPTLQTHSVNLHHGHAPFFRVNANQRLGGIGSQSPMNFFPTRTSTRSFGGISVSGTENDAGIFIPTPTEKCYELLEYIHDNAGLPWWLTILATTILLRGVVVFPFAVWQQKILARIENAQPMINAYVEQIKQKLALHAKEEGWSQRHMAKVFSNEVRMLVSNVHFREHCSSHKLSYLPFWQAGVWTCMTTSIGQMTGKYPELFSTELDIDVLPALASEGFLWFSDLMQTDLTLAVLLGVINVTLVELWSLRRGPLTRTQHYLQNTFRIVAICSVPAAAMLPSAVSFYWLMSSLCGLGQLALLRSPSVRRMLGIPHAPSEMKRPMEEMKTALQARYAKRTF
ncbi:cytochrome c oxidase assembly protein COX18, mitochondrial-like [Strongylocentrotus purpuratus]|uniref:Mitochondrial inner membrane protein COX18 n=1 Tax=Strongylocentrotus purpuratus TaxID=7668 RepID=A0A7M7SVY2_STRPU|nr:cytochrome c oxidase assembly protein COX18, mitochondrial-like [Strongylocentrotus purpuratus]